MGSAETQCRNPVAVENHLNFYMMATSLVWIYACRLEKLHLGGKRLKVVIIPPFPMYENWWRKRH
ncbi:MAG: hypothetical protein V2B20_21730 [Pseudomonadota bacterium]